MNETRWLNHGGSLILVTMLTAAQCRIARAALQMDVEQLAERARVSGMTVWRFEKGKTGGRAETVRKLEAVLEEAGVVFIPGDDGFGAGVRFRDKSRR